MHCKSGQLREERHSSMSFKCRLSVTTASSRTDALVRLRTKHLSAMRRDHSSAEKDANARLQQRCHMRADICGELEDRQTRVNVRKMHKTTSSRAGAKRRLWQVQVHQRQWQHHADNGSLCRCQIGPRYRQQTSATLLGDVDDTSVIALRDGCDSSQGPRQEPKARDPDVARWPHHMRPPALCGHKGDNGDDNGRWRSVDNVGQQQAAAGMATARQQ
ncbi:hypothetical protein EDB83DRAFT_2315066 [Lactarius deliciosus]|nr:hypothetical protein EDB83DRAFT_2315066 [Lactarius deliciosus]